MKKNLLKVCVAVILSIGLASCDKEEDDIVKPAELSEFKFIRVLVNDELSSQISLVDPSGGVVTSYESGYPKSALYNTQAGRFGALVNTANNHVQLFDTGLEGHGDHVDLKGTPKFASLIGDGNKPTHFKSKGDEIITFNDGDGTLAIAKEADFHVAGAKMQIVRAGNVAHHGAMTKFDNGSYAITEKDGSVAGSLPERVKIIDATGKTIYPSAIQTKGIHGNASDGQVSLFGSSSGILVVEPNGTQKLIPHPESFQSAWFGSILEAKGAGKFIGYSAAVGAYVIDVPTSKVIPVVESTDLLQVKIDYAGNQLIALFYSGEVKVYDLRTNSLIKSGSIIAPVAKDEKQKPQIEATSRFLYITQPKSGELYQVNLTDFGNIKKLKVSTTPYRLTVLGIESNEGH